MGLVTHAGKGMRALGAGTDRRGPQKTLEALEAERAWGGPPRTTKSCQVCKQEQTAKESHRLY